MAEFIDDSIDFSAYIQEPTIRQYVRPASSYVDEVVEQFLSPDEQRGCYLPWSKTNALFRIRPGELTLWPGINGHGKSALLGQIMLACMAQGERVLVASMEMRPRQTLQRMTRQVTRGASPTVSAIREFHSWSDGRLWLYDHYGATQWTQLLAVFRYCVDKLAINQFVIDSLMRCAIREDDYNEQKAFLDALCNFKHDNNVSVHLVMHSRKREDEMHPPGKFDAKGTGTMTDLADNVLTVWRNKAKERAVEKAGASIPMDVAEQPDTLIICDKQRNFDWEGRIALWYHRESMQFVERRDASPGELMEFMA